MEKGGVLVTGGSRRIGRVIALALADAGHCVAILTRSPSPEGAAVVAEIEARGVKGMLIEGDLSNEDSIRGIFTRVAEFLGPMTGLVNCASLFEWDDINSVSYKSILDHSSTNLAGPLILTSDLITYLKENSLGNGTGCIVNVLDQKLASPNGDHLSYTVSKYALEGATRALSRSLAPIARINAVSPGHTLQSPEQTDRGFALAQSQSPLGYGPTPEDIAQTVILYFSVPSLTGQVITVDSGEHMMNRSRDVVFETEGLE